MASPPASSQPGVVVTAIPRHAGAPVPAQIAEASEEDVWYWHEQVQPHVRKAREARFDRRWHWPNLVKFAESAEWLVGQVGNRPPCVLTVLQALCARPDGTAWPVGQMLLASGYPFLGDRDVSCVFVWYMAAAPRSALRAAGLPADLRLGRILVDSAVQESFLQGLGGRILLHAASSRWNPIANFRLYRLYEHIGLTPLRDFRRVSLARRNDLRYFYLEPARALEFLAPQDYLRPQEPP